MRKAMIAVSIAQSSQCLSNFYQDNEDELGFGAPREIVTGSEAGTRILICRLHIATRLLIIDRWTMRIQPLAPQAWNPSR
jgi:hypothetical protein